MHCMQRARWKPNDTKLCCLYDCSTSVQTASLPQSASNKTVVEYFAPPNIVQELELTNGSVCKAWFTKLEKAAAYLATAENIADELGTRLALSLPL